MASTMTKPIASKEVQSLDGIRPVMAKAVQPSPTAGSDAVRRALVKACGSMKAAAISMGIDQSQLNRELDSERFNLVRVNALDLSERAKFYQQMHQEHEPLDTPQVRAMRLLAEVRRLFDELEQVVEH